MPVLGIDTATVRGGLALAADGRLLAEDALPERGWHARDLLSRLDGLLRGAGLAPRDLTGIGVAAGPGSFTGLRIGMATAKGLAYALRIGLAGISTLEALARAAARLPGASSADLCPALDAGRGEVYAALFRAREGRPPARLQADRSWRPSDLAAALTPGTTLVGDGSGAVLEAGRAAGRALEVLEPCPALAGAIALWAEGAIPPGEGYRPGRLVPNYIRPSDAEAARRRP